MKLKSLSKDEAEKKTLFTRLSGPRQHVHCLDLGFRRKSIMSGVCFHERPILIFCIKFLFKKERPNEKK